MFDVMESISFIFCILTYAIIYVLIHHIIFRLYLYFLNIVLYFFKHSRTNIFHRRGLYTFYLIFDDSDGSNWHYRQKIWNIFHFSEFWYFVGCVRYLFMWFTFLQTDITFGDLIHIQKQNEPQRFKNYDFGPFSFLDAG